MEHVFLIVFYLIVIPSVSVFAKTPKVDNGYYNRRSPVVEVVEKKGGAVVNISTERTVKERVNPFGDPFFDRFFSNFFDSFPQRKYKQQSLGSGVIISEDGYILTNEHVILKASEIKVTLADEREFDAELVGSDSKSDLAVIKIKSKTAFPFIKMGKSDDLMIGESVIAIGNPFGLSHTVTTGVVSALNRSVKIDNDRVYKDFIQTDASINPGNSGGPLLNINGELIGINTAIYQEAEGIGFAIPISRAERIVDDLINYGSVHKAWLGISVQNIDDDLVKYFNLEKKKGVIITKIIKKSAASKAGLKRGDIIIKMGNNEVGSREDYRSIISGYTADDKIDISIIRDGKQQQFTIISQEIPPDAGKELVVDLLGLEVQSIDSIIALRYGIKDKQGVIITKVFRGSVSERAGLEKGDIIRQANNQRIEDEDKFYKIMVLLTEQESMLLLIQRGRYIYPLTIQP